MANRLGSMWMNRVSQLTGPTPTGRFSKFALLVPRINALEPVFEPLTDDELKHRSHELRLRARQGDSLNFLLVEAYALVRDAATQTIGQHHFVVHFLCGSVPHKKCISELETGE